MPAVEWFSMLGEHWYTQNSTTDILVGPQNRQHTQNDRDEIGEGAR